MENGITLRKMKIPIKPMLKPANNKSPIEAVASLKLSFVS